MEHQGIAPIPKDSDDGRRIELAAEHACLKEFLQENRKDVSKTELKQCTEDKIREMLSGKMY
jgi:hypothetical protein